MAEGQSDSDLVVRTLEGDQQAFGVLVARYRRAVVGVAFHRTGSFEEARDIAQETFLKAYLNLPKLRKPDSFASWLYHIADLTALSIARRPRREVPLPSDEALISPAPEAQASELTQQVREALATLDEPTRLAVVLHYIDGYSHAEVAHFLGTTAGAVRTRVSRAKSRLREEIMSETERALKEAVARVLAAVSARDWQAALDEVRRSGLPPEQHPDLAYGAGLAQAVLGRRPFNPRLLSEGANLLFRAWKSGRHDPETTWQLVSAFTALGEWSRVPPVLVRYLEETPDPGERLRAGVALARAWQMLGDHAAAVNAHRTSLAGLGEQADLTAKLDSYLGAHTVMAYAYHGAGAEWLGATLKLWYAAPESVRTPEQKRGLLSSVCTVYWESGKQIEAAREVALRLVEDLVRGPRAEEGKDAPATLRAKGEWQIELYRCYSMLGLPGKAQEALAAAKEVAEELARRSEESGPDREAWQEAAFITTANAGILGRYWGDKREALTLLRKAEQLAPAKPEVSIVRFYLAAAVLQSGGEKQEALRFLRRVGEERPWACSGVPQQEFSRDPAFASVRDDPEFLAVVNGWREAGA
jgi:RNA polymerase sigma-70 factor (ECF subfamily)